MLETMHRHDPSGVELAKPVLLPDVEDFADLFEVTDKRGYYCALSKRKAGHASYRVRPTAITEEAVKENMLEGLGIYFEAIEHGNGRTLIVATYEQIIGSRYLAYVKTGTVPWQ